MAHRLSAFARTRAQGLVHLPKLVQCDELAAIRVEAREQLAELIFREPRMHGLSSEHVCILIQYDDVQTSCACMCKLTLLLV